MGITNQTGLVFGDGILGLSPDDTKNGPSFVANLKNQGLIDKKMISFYLSKTTGSKFTFGGYLENMIKANQAVVWENMVSVDSGRYYWWQL